jgi:hypothetical protein
MIEQMPTKLCGGQYIPWYLKEGLIHEISCYLLCLPGFGYFEQNLLR